MTQPRRHLSPGYQRYRRIKDRLIRQLIRLAATSVILALASLFLFLFWETLPLFGSADMREESDTQQTVKFVPSSDFQPSPPIPSGSNLSAHAIWLYGQASVILVDSQGQISQWLINPLQPESSEMILAKQFPIQRTDTRLLALPGSKGFISYDPSGLIRLYHATSGNMLAEYQSQLLPLEQIHVSENGGHIQLQNTIGQQQTLQLHNPHPDFSWSLLWKPWLYEGHQQADYIWQTSANTDRFEAKYSFVPLSIGTLKAAVYAMMFAMPLAILAAIYTACFLSERTRAWVKPAVELAEAFPTVVLGFIAGLWLAPLLEQHLATALSLLLLTPLLLILIHALLYSTGLLKESQTTQWSGLPRILILLLVALLLAWQLGHWLELWLFKGNMIEWMTTQGIDYQQRNGLVVGLMMGLAIMPVIFSLTEDALISVPDSLRQGAMALGASPWQAVIRVVVPTAAAGIFAAIMIGTGRALGETMILLMASGNSPVSDFSLFEGMRSLAANLSIETPEAMQSSTHYRVLILSATLLFLSTFIMNTLAAVVRENLYRHYRHF
ncbi:ABC transporter permease subunit [Nitrincola iocasae]|uniref:ABC transporter permease subunit n=1 Tax=Nitrincola iocasae TaxID=2614693 RepID=A0A5J6LI52_9GAMM|nr:ABC transporter permease subunit [Nitrincola iocasae]QEW08269.1 ABC transporter permease subunit [Nitrincola iocasae]